MGIFDKAKAALDAAKDKVSDATGFDADKLIEAAKGVTDAGSSLADAGSSLDEAAAALKEGKRE
jgi:hypothetical protein